ncbi:hypothetical protein ACHAPT_010361 [Fusarium lateritium]
MDGLVRGAFGQLVPIGTLYNANTDSFLDASILHDGLPLDAIVPKRGTKTETTCNSNGKYRSRLEPLGVSHDTAASILCGLIKPRGSSDYLQEAIDSGHSLHGACHHTFTAMTEALNPNKINVKEHIDFIPLQTLDSTHVVTGIDWGMRNTLTIEHELSEDCNRSEVERAFLRDLSQLEIITQFLEGDTDFYSFGVTRLELPYTMRLYTDSHKEGLNMDSLITMHSFARRHLADRHKTNNGKGWPLSYTLVPIDRLHKLVSGFERITITPIPLPIQDFGKFMGLFDEFTCCKKRLDNQRKGLMKKRPLNGDKLTETINGSIDLLDLWKIRVQQMLARVVVGIRQGIVDPGHLHGLYTVVEAEAESPRNISTMVGQETAKVLLVNKAIAAGAIYIGQGESPLDKIKTPRHDNPGCYAFLFNDRSIQQKIAWGHQCDSLMRLLVRPNQDKPVYVVDCDAPSCLLQLEEARVVRYQRGHELINELGWEPRVAPAEGFNRSTQGGLNVEGSEQKHFVPENSFTRPSVVYTDTDDAQDAEDAQELDPCLARYIPGSLDTTDTLKAVDRRFVKIPCPGRHCDPKIPREWVCSRCLAPLEFGMTDDLIYCDCGHCLYSAFDFKCNGKHHGPGFDRYSSRQLLTMLRSLKSDSLNILILGETGVGKSTFINGFVNYLTYNSLDEAKAAKDLTSLISCSFSTQVMNRGGNPSQEIQERIIRVPVGSKDDEADGVDGRSATQRTTVHAITVGTTTYRLIDTPGMGDTRGAKHDKANMADMIQTLSSYEVLHGILILLKSNSSRLKVMFKFCIKELLTHLHRSAVSNLVFGFTNTRAANYTVGDAYGPLKKLLEEHADLGLALNMSTMYCFDSESFRYLAAYKRGVQLPDEDVMRKSWDYSKGETQRLVDYFRTRPPHNVNSTLSMNGARQQVSQLMKPISEILRRLSYNVDKLNQSVNDLSDVRLKGEDLVAKLHPIVIQFNSKQLAQPQTVCTARECCEFKAGGKGDKEVIRVYKTHCHPACRLSNVQQDVLADPGLIKCRAFKGNKNCKVCGHHWRQHMHVLYELEETKVKVKDKKIEGMLKSNTNDVTVRQRAITHAQKLIGEYQDELDQLRKARAQLVVFLMKNAMTPINDATVEYLDLLIQDEKTKIESGRQLGLPVDKNKETLEALRRDRKAHLDLVNDLKQDMIHPTDQPLTEKGIEDLIKTLYGLKHFGKTLKGLRDTITSSHKATLRERSYRVSRPTGKRQFSRGGFGNETIDRGRGVEPRVVQRSKQSSRRRRGQSGGLGGWFANLSRR